MTRGMKTKTVIRYSDRITGRRSEPSVSPRQRKVYGRTLPAAYAARFFLSCERRTTRLTRDLWAESRLRERTRVNGRRYRRALTINPHPRCVTARRPAPAYVGRRRAA